jgi:CHAD domain-containing protein
MAGPWISPKRFAKRYRIGVKELSDLARSLPDRPSPDEVHRIRVAARRVQAMKGLLPKKSRRSKPGRSFGIALASFLKSTSQVRDLDTLMMTLETEKASLPSELMRSLENERSDFAATTRPASQAFSRVEAPSIDPSQVDSRRLARRLGKRIRERAHRVAVLLSIVTSDESKVDELHSLRKEVKKLRYVMELGDVASSELNVLAQWQEALGAIHDLDVAIDYLRRGRWKLEPAIEVFRRRRHLIYRRFVSLQQIRPKDVIWKGDILTPRPGSSNVGRLGPFSTG